MNNNATLLRLTLNNGTVQNLEVSDVEDAILTFRRSRNARFVRNELRASSFTFSIDGGATWLS
jgi:hypothetical protein